MVIRVLILRCCFKRDWTVLDVAEVYREAVSGNGKCGFVHDHSFIGFAFQFLDCVYAIWHGSSFIKHRLFSEPQSGSRLSTIGVLCVLVEFGSRGIKSVLISRDDVGLSCFHVGDTELHAGHCLLRIRVDLCDLKITTDQVVADGCVLLCQVNHLSILFNRELPGDNALVQVSCRRHALNDLIIAIGKCVIRRLRITVLVKHKGHHDLARLILFTVYHNRVFAPVIDLKLCPFKGETGLWRGLSGIIIPLLDHDATADNTLILCKLITYLNLSKVSYLPDLRKIYAVINRFSIDGSHCFVVQGVTFRSFCLFNGYRAKRQCSLCPYFVEVRP